jgi:hypothetical protein
MLQPHNSLEHKDILEEFTKSDEEPINFTSVRSELDLM